MSCHLGTVASAAAAASAKCAAYHEGVDLVEDLLVRQRLPVGSRGTQQNVEEVELLVGRLEHLLDRAVALVAAARLQRLSALMDHLLGQLLSRNNSRIRQDLLMLIQEHEMRSVPYRMDELAHLLESLTIGRAARASGSNE